MGVSCNLLPSALFCGEDIGSILGLNDEPVVLFDQGREESTGIDDDDPISEGFLLLPSQSDESMAELIRREEQQQQVLGFEGYSDMLKNTSLDSSVRNPAISWMLKVCSIYKFGPLCAYLSVNYLDRFLALFKLPHRKDWMQQLLSVACLSLASKMEESETPMPHDLQVVGGSVYLFEPRTIQRMELLVLATLNWRMQAVTPFCFADYFLRKFNNGKQVTRASMSRCTELVMSTLKGTDFLSFRPSEVAAAAALMTGMETAMVGTCNVIVAQPYVSTERTMRCCEMMMIQELVKKRRKGEEGLITITTSSSQFSLLLAPFFLPESPSGVLDAAAAAAAADDDDDSMRSRDDHEHISSSISSSSSSSEEDSSSPAPKRRRTMSKP